jgi:Bacterial tandem repeat domain 1
VNINLSTPICGRSVIKRCPFHISMSITLIATAFSAAPVGAQQAEGIIVVSNKTNDTILTSGANGPGGHVDGAWEYKPMGYYPCGIDGTVCVTNPDGSPPALLGPGQSMGFASVLQSGVASGTGGTVALADYSKSEVIGSFTWSVPWCAFHGCGSFPPVGPTSCGIDITPAPGTTFAPIVKGWRQNWAGQTSCSFGYEITNGQVGSTSQGLMTSGQALSRGTSLNKVSSTDGRYTLQLQTDGNLALMDSGANPPKALWTAGTANTAASVALMQSDGNFVLYDQNVNVVWASNTANNPGAYLTVEDGFLLIHAGNGATLKTLGSDQDLYAGIWQKVPSVPWVAKHGMTAAQYQQEFDTLLAQGYRPVVVSGYSLLDQPVYAAIWEKRASVPWAARHGLTSAQYQQEFDSLVGQGYRPVWVSGYNVGGQDLYAAIFEKPELDLPWVAKHGMTASEYQQQFDNLGAQGYRLEEVSGYSIAGQARYAAIWDKPPLSVPWVAKHGMTPAEYQQQFDTLIGQGYRLVQVSGYSVAGQTLYAAIWEQSPGAPWVARDGLTSAQYQQEFDQLLSQSYRLTDVSGYNVP